MTNRQEDVFHFSVAKWLHTNGYKFFHEMHLPNSRSIPDFLVVSQTGERFVMECKLTEKSATKRWIARTAQYLTMLKDPEAKAFIVFPAGTRTGAAFSKWCEAKGVGCLFIDIENPTPWRHMFYALDSEDIADHFPSYRQPLYTPVINKWGRLLLD